MSLKKRATRGMVWTFAEQFGNQIVGFGISIVLARMLLPEQFGLIGMISIFVAIGNTLLHAGLTKSLIRGENLSTHDYSTVFFFNFIASIIVYLSLYILSPFIADFYNQPILEDIIRLYCLTFIISGLSAVQLARLTKVMNFKTQTLIAIPSAVIGGIVGVILAYNGYGVWSLVWSSISSSIISTSLLWLLSDWRPKWIFDVEKFKYHFNYGSKLTLAELLDKFFSNIFLIVIGKFFSAAQVGLYTRAETMNQLPVKNISRALDRVTFPLFVSIQNDDSRLKKIYSKLLKLVVFIITPVMIILGVLAEPIFRYLFTENWLDAVPYFQILCITGILYPLHSYNLDILNVKGRSDLFLKLEVVKKFLIILVLVITVPIGLKALLYGQVAISFIAFFINAHYSGKFIKYTAARQILDILPIFILSSLIGLGIYVLDRIYLIGYSDIYRIIIGSTTSLILYMTIAYFFKFESFIDLKKILSKNGSSY